MPFLPLLELYSIDHGSERLESKGEETQKIGFVYRWLLFARVKSDCCGDTATPRERKGEEKRERKRVIEKNLAGQGLIEKLAFVEAI